MGYEIERKFLLKNDAWRDLAQGQFYRQGYLASNSERSVRIRTMGDCGILTIKGPTENGARREYEYEVPLSDAIYMLKNICMQPIIEKTRYRIKIPPFIWEVDEFAGENKGLIIAEVELESIDQPVHPPEWIGREVTSEQRYFNASLVTYPYNKWRDEEKL